MKRLLLFGACIVLMGTLVAKAETINVTATRTSFDATWDVVTLNIASMTGEVPQGDVVTLLIGTWTANGGVFALPPTPGGHGNTPWYDSTTNDDDYQDTDTYIGAPRTWLDFSTRTPDTPTRSAGDFDSNSFYIGEYITLAGTDGVPGYALAATDYTPGSSGTGQGYGFDNTLLGKFYVSKSTTWGPGGDRLRGCRGLYGAGGWPRILGACHHRADRS